MKKLLFIFVAVIMAVSAMSANASDNVCLIWNMSELDNISDNSRKKLLSDADLLLTSPIPSVTDKSTTRSNNIHNYESLAIYLWPDPSNPDGPYITHDGEVNPEYKKYDSPRLGQISYDIMNLSKAYYVSNNTKYLDRCLVLMRSWFIDSDTRMNPNFEYGQFIPGRNGGKGYPGCISEAYELTKVLEAISLLKSCNAMDKKIDKNMKKWFKKLAKWLKSSTLGRQMHDQTDNLGIIYDSFLYRISVYTGDIRTCNAIINDFTPLRLNKHIAENGHQIFELKRTRAMGYSIYNLKHIIDFCYMLEKSGTHYYSQNHERIDAAMAFLYQYMGKKEEFPYKEIGDWKSIEKELEREYSRLEKLKQHNL